MIKINKGITFSYKKKPIIIAEISGNHNGNKKKFLSLVKSAFANGADLVKIQTYEPKDITLNIFGCLIFLFLSHWLIDIGRFNSLSILFLQLPLFWFSCFMGFIEDLLKIWTDAELSTKPHSPRTREKLCV